MNRNPGLTIVNKNCLDVLQEYKDNNTRFDSVITDPPFEIGLHGKRWDSTGIAFSRTLWDLLFAVLKPGGFIAAFAASRMYHRLACAAEDAGFDVFPALYWSFEGGLPKPANLSEMFDREVPDRRVIGTRKGSGFTSANVRHGAQNRSRTDFDVKERYLTPTSQKWRGYYYGVNCFKPVLEPIFLGQKPCEGRIVDNVRRYGVGALNLGKIEERTGAWATTILRHKKVRRAEHKSDHPSVKPTGVMDDLCALLCPSGGTLLDPFAGTGTTALAAMNNGLNCVLIELDQQMIPVIRRRIKEHSSELAEAA